jgi:hypothetical protein
MGCHVAPCYWLLVKIYGVRGDRTLDLPHRSKPLQSLRCQHAPLYSLLYIWFDIYLSLSCVPLARGSGLGLSPSPRSHIALTYDPLLYRLAHVRRLHFDLVSTVIQTNDLPLVPFLLAFGTEPRLRLRVVTWAT